MSKAGLIDPISCPVCTGEATLMTGRCDSMQRMAQALGVDAPGRQESGAAGLARCLSCSLEFAFPMRGPGPEFYKWLTRSGFYYPARRWEWSACASRIARKARQKGGDYVVIDFGSGSGQFIRELRSIAGVSVFGLDHNSDVVAACRAEGLEVIAGGVGDLSVHWPAGVDMITFWHVVEHVEDPVALLSDARARLRSGGELCFSVPLTPMSYEHSWPDPFNEPPHHLTRWNLRALDALATRLGMRAEYVFPSASPILARLVKALMVQAMPPFGVRGRLRKGMRLVTYLLTHPAALFMEIARQRRHPRREGRVLPDLVLVSLRP